MFMGTQLIGFGAGSGDVPVVLTYRTALSSTSDLTDYSGQFDGVSIGTASSTRRVHVAIVGSNGTTTLSSVTIGGQSATINVEAQSSNRTVAIATALVPTGTTADIDVIWNAGQARMGVGVWTSTGLASSTTTDTASDTTTSDPSTASLSTSDGGFALAVCAGAGFVGGNISWTTMTERYDADIESASLVHSGADYATDGSTLNISVSAAGGNTVAGMCAASFG